MEQMSFIPLLSPCKGVCSTDNRGYCQGCFRSREERFGWLEFSDAKKLDIIRLCQRRQKYRQYQLNKKLQTLQKQAQQSQNLAFDFPDNLQLD